MHEWSGHDDAGSEGCASFRRVFVLFCAWVRFNSDPFNAYNDEIIWGMVEVGGMESVLEGRREAAGEQSADYVRDWVGTMQGMDCGNDKTFSIIVC